MYNREEEILEQYDIEIRNTSRGRGAFICDTDKGTMLLKEFRGSMERAEFLYNILEFLSEESFLAESVVPTKEGNMLARDEAEGKSYLLKNWYTGKECDVKNRDHILVSVRKLAAFHNIGRCYGREIPQFLMAEPDELLKEYEKHNRELNKVKNYIRSKHKKNEFEMLFMKVYDSYRSQAMEVTEQLKIQLETLTEEEKQQMYGLCHGDYNQHNVIFSQGDCILLNFEQMCYNIQISDLANFARKILEKHNWNARLGMDIISAYDKIHKLLPQECRQLYLRLAYPQKYWKIANHYYNSRKSWISGRDIEKLEKIMEQEKERTQFLKMLFYFTS